MATEHMTLQQYKDALRVYDEDFLLCKDMRHQWELVQPYEKKRSGWVTRVLECSRCGTLRTDTYAIINNERLARAGSTYRYPTGFSMRGLPQVDKVPELTRFEAYRRAQENERQSNGNSRA
jgi:hypothetical protein